MVNFAQFTLGYIGMEAKDTAKAQAELTKTLQMDPTNAQASSMLAGFARAAEGTPGIDAAGAV